MMLVGRSSLERVCELSATREGNVAISNVETAAPDWASAGASQGLDEQNGFNQLWLRVQGARDYE